MGDPKLLKLMFEAGNVSAKISDSITELGTLTRELNQTENGRRVPSRGASAESAKCPDCYGHRLLTAPTWANDQTGDNLTVVHKWLWRFMSCPTCDGSGWVFNLEVHQPLPSPRP